MIRRYVVFGAAGLTVLCALLFIPVAMTYTLIAGEKSTAAVRKCVVDLAGGRERVDCEGTWRTEDGATGGNDGNAPASGHVH